MVGTQEIRAGLSISLTGRFARQGQQALDGLRLWESYINDRGGIVVRSRSNHVGLLAYDDGSSTARARENASRLLRSDAVHVLLGPYSSALTRAVAQVAREHNRVLWNHGGAADDVANDARLVSTLSPASDYFRALPQWLAREHPKLRSIAVAYNERGSFASHIVRGLTEAASQVGQHSIQRVAFRSPLQDERSVFNELSRTQPGVIVLAGSFEDEIRMLRARSWPAPAALVVAVAAGVRAFQEELGDAAEGIIGPSQWEPGLDFADIVGPDSAWFLSSFRSLFGYAPDYLAAGSFAIGIVLAECIQHAGSLDNDALYRAASQLDIATFYGRFRMDPAGGRQVGHRMMLVQWRGGRKVLLA
ncbi:MAG TPA: amino acid ABC transporter substrate-binding protein [Terriglobales bacterium]|nr:amino acid ABC transporter substrate-binding protein [Terriglobales bacterium]